MKFLRKSIVRKVARVLGIIFIAYFSVVGLGTSYSKWQYNRARRYVENKEASRDYHKDLLFLKPQGVPIFWVKPENTKTLFFVEGFRGQVGAGIYKEWFEELHKEHNINIIAPIIGLQGWPFKYRNREWSHYEHMRQALQIYNAYTANLNKDHTIIVGSMSFGTLSSVTINAFAERKPDASVMCSPLNTGLEYKSGGPIVQWFATQTW